MVNIVMAKETEDKFPLRYGVNKCVRYYLVHDSEVYFAYTYLHIHILLLKCYNYRETQCRRLIIYLQFKAKINYLMRQYATM